MHLRFGDAGGPTISVSGEIHCADIERFSDALTQVTARGGRSVYLDLSGVTSWSIVAQIAVLSVARELSARRSPLVLVGASLDLRRQSQRLDVFNRVHALASQGEPWWGTGTGTGPPLTARKPGLAAGPHG